METPSWCYYCGHKAPDHYPSCRRTGVATVHGYHGPGDGCHDPACPYNVDDCPGCTADDAASAGRGLGTAEHTCGVW